MNGAPVVVAADHGPWRVDYANHLNGWPRTVRIRSTDAGRRRRHAPASISSRSTRPIDDKAFAVDVPPDAERDHARTIFAPSRRSRGIERSDDGARSR